MDREGRSPKPSYEKQKKQILALRASSDSFLVCPSCRVRRGEGLQERPEPRLPSPTEAPGSAPIHPLITTPLLALLPGLGTPASTFACQRKRRSPVSPCACCRPLSKLSWGLTISRGVHFIRAVQSHGGGLVTRIRKTPGRLQPQPKPAPDGLPHPIKERVFPSQTVARLCSHAMSLRTTREACLKP